jgi:hypothetical protein
MNTNTHELVKPQRTGEHGDFVLRRPLGTVKIQNNASRSFLFQRQSQIAVNSKPQPVSEVNFWARLSTLNFSAAPCDETKKLTQLSLKTKTTTQTGLTPLIF